MKNTDVLRRVRFTFDFGDDRMIALFELGGFPSSRTQISDWLKKDDHPDYKPMQDKHLAHFLNGLIVQLRGQGDKPMPDVESRLSNNLIFKKIKIALQLQDEHIMEIYDLASFKISKHEISAFFRKPDQPQYREMKDQFLRNFLDGLQKKYRP